MNTLYYGDNLEVLKENIEDDYEILYELYFHNASIHQLSKKLGISRSTVRYRRNKAIKSLKEIISKNK